MARLPKRYYSLLLLTCIFVLAGCELRRDSSDFSDPGPVADVPPTLAPLGAQTDIVVEDSANPEAIVEESAAMQPADDTVDAAAETIEVADASVIEVESEPEVTTIDDSVVSDNVEEASSITPVEETTPEEIVVAQEAVVVDAPADDLPVGGPVAANPPASDTIGDYTGSAIYSDTNYTVQSGDTLYSIATRYGTTVQAIIFTNSLPSDFIYAGQELNIPSGDVTVPQYEQPIYNQPTFEQPAYSQPYTAQPGTNYHTIAPGETLYRIALQYSTSVDAIAGANGIPFPYIIQAGQQLVIPTPGTFVAPPPPPAGGYYDQPYAQPYQDYQEYQQSPQVPTNEYYEPAPFNDGTHTVAPGETLYSIALRYGTSADTLAATNGLYNPNQIYVGQVLYLP